MGMRKLPFVFSLVILVAAGVAYRLFYENQLAYVKARNARLLAMPERTLVRTFRAGGPDIIRRFTREGSRLKVQVRRSRERGPAAAGASPEFQIAFKDVLLQVPLGLDAFDLLFVADDKGEVIEQIGDETLRRNTLGGISSPEGKPFAIPEMWNATVEATATLSGREFALACHPMILAHEVVPATPGANSSRKGLVFCGATSQQRLRGQALCISPILVVTLIAVVVLALLTPPFIKLSLLGPTEKLRFGDVYALGLCGFLGLLVLPVAVLDIALVGSLRAQADGVLKAVSTDVREHLEDEIRRIRHQLAVFDRAIVGTATPPECVNVLGLFGETLPACAKRASDDTDYPYFESVGWADLDGEQTVRWWAIPRPRVGFPRFPVRDREYFTAVRDGQLWPPYRSHAPAEQSGPYFLQAVRSFRTGQTRAVLSIPSAGKGKPLVAAMTTSLISLSQPVLPPRIGFAVVDQAGEVLFHSDARQSLTHNLFAEAGENADLRATVAAREPTFVQGRYWGQSQRFHVMPLTDIPWTVVAFRKEDLLRAANVEIVGGAVMLAVLYASCAFVAPSLAWLAFGKRRTGWLWPSEGRALVYAELVVTLSAIGLALFATMADARPRDAVALLPLIPCLLVGVTILAFRVSPLLRLTSSLPASWRDRVVATCRRRFLALHVAASLLFAFLYAALPGVAITKAAAERELQALAHHEQRWLLARDAERSLAVRKFYGKPLKLDAKPDGNLVRKRLAEVSDRYEFRLFTSGLSVFDLSARSRWFGASALVPRSERGFPGLLEAASASPPLLDPVAAELRHLPALEPVSGDWESGSDGKPGIVLRSDPVVAAGSEGFVGPWPGLWTEVGAWPLYAILLLAAPTGWGLDWCARRLFVAGTARPPARSVEVLRNSSLPSSICLVPSTLDADRLLEGGWVCGVSVASGAFACPGADDPRPLVVDLRGWQAADSVRREAVLDCVERRTCRPDRRTYLVTCTHPTDLFAAGTGGLAGAATTSPLEADRWLRLFDTLGWVALREEGDETAEETWHGEAEPLARQLLGRSASPVLVRSLASELAGSARLRRLAEQLAPDSFVGLSESEVLGRLAEAGAGYYRALWIACSPEERRVLAHLCDESFVNPRLLGALKKLLDRGLVHRDPVLRPMTRSFEVFVREIGGSAGAADPTCPRESIGWPDLELPFVTVAAVCGLFLLLSHQEVLDISVPVLSALGATGVPILAKTASFLKNLADGRSAIGRGHV
jgi:hypothetical protein